MENNLSEKFLLTSTNLGTTLVQSKKSTSIWNDVRLSQVLQEDRSISTLFMRLILLQLPPQRYQRVVHSLP